MMGQGRYNFEQLFPLVGKSSWKSSLLAAIPAATHRRSPK